jgi:S1-C subfamily serine protease
MGVRIKKAIVILLIIVAAFVLAIGGSYKVDRQLRELKTQEKQKKEAFGRAFAALKRIEEGKKSKELSIVEIIPKIKSGVVHIEAPRWQGSGFVVGPNLILTARHCLEGVEDFEITTDDGHKLHATRALSSDNHDVGFIYVDDLTCVAEDCEKDGMLLGEHKAQLHVLKLGSIAECQLGETVVTIGSPYGKVNFNSVTLGIISGLDRSYDALNDSYSGDYGWSIAFQTDSPGHPGNSGCPIFTTDGVVRGVLVGGFSPSLIIAMPVDIVLEEIELVKQKFIMNKYYEEETPEDPYYNYREDTEYYE